MASGRTMGAILAGAVLAGLIVGGAMAIWRPPASDTATVNRTPTATAAASPTGAASSGATSSASASASTSASPSASMPSPAPATFVAAPWATKGLELSSLKSVTRTGDDTAVITVDRLTYYSGAQAAKYYDTHPDLERLDYAVVNQNPRIYSFHLVPGTPVFLGPMIGRTDPPSASDLQGLVDGFAQAKAQGREVFVWLRHNDKDNGWVTYLAEQYFP